MSKFRIDVSTLDDVDWNDCTNRKCILVENPDPSDILRGNVPHLEERLLPSFELKEWMRENDQWHEYCRRYGVELSKYAEQCEELRISAEQSGLVLLHRSTDSLQNDAHALKKHLIHLECKHRWNRGFIIGGFTKPIKDEIVKNGGLWYPWHRAWMMPDEKTYRHILSLMPVDI